LFTLLNVYTALALDLNTCFTIKGLTENLDFATWKLKWSIDPSDVVKLKACSWWDCSDTSRSMDLGFKILNTQKTNGNDYCTMLNTNQVEFEPYSQGSNYVLVSEQGGQHLYTVDKSLCLVSYDNSDPYRIFDKPNNGFNCRNLDGEIKGCPS